MNPTAFYYHAAELIKLVAEHVADDEHSIILITDLGNLALFKKYEGIADIKEALEARLIAKKEELYETLSSFLPSVSPQTRELTIQNLQGVFEKINESHFFDLAK